MFSKVEGYNVTSDNILDIMYDFQDGVCSLGMCKVLAELCEVHDINIETIFNRIQSFHFGRHTNRQTRLVK